VEIGTAINVLAVLAGGSIGTLAGARLPEGMRSTAMQAIGIVTLLVGVSHFLKVDTVLVPLVSVILGLVVGELLDVDAQLRRLGGHLEERFSKGDSPVSRAFVTTSLVFCVGPLTVIGSLRDGLNGDYSLLALKSALNFIAALAFASVLGCAALGRDGPCSTGLIDTRGRVSGRGHNRTHDLVDDRHRRHPDLRTWPWTARPEGDQGG
jgi:uncharacterized protein